MSDKFQFVELISILLLLILTALLLRLVILTQKTPFVFWTKGVFLHNLLECFSVALQIGKNLLNNL